MHQDPQTVNLAVEICICLHNLMHITYPGEMAGMVDRDGPDMHVILGAWRDNDVLQDLAQARRGLLQQEKKGSNVST